MDLAIDRHTNVLSEFEETGFQVTSEWWCRHSRCRASAEYPRILCNAGRLTVKVTAQKPRLTWPWNLVLTHANVLWSLLVNRFILIAVYFPQSCWRHVIGRLFLNYVHSSVSWFASKFRILAKSSSITILQIVTSACFVYRAATIQDDVIEGRELCYKLQYKL